MDERERGEKGGKDGRTMGGRDLELKKDALAKSITNCMIITATYATLLQYCSTDLVLKLMIVELDKMTTVCRVSFENNAFLKAYTLGTTSYEAYQVQS